jgi:hypothetical protein
MSITVTAQTEINFNFSSLNDLNGATSAPAKREYSSRGDSKRAWTFGTGVSMATRPYAKRRSLTAASGTDDINLSALVCPDFGDTINFETIRVIYIKNQEPVSANGANLLIKPAPSNGWTALFNDAVISSGNVIKLGPQDEFYLSRMTTGILCPTIASVLRISHDGGSSGALDYDFALLGTV